jgi:hypothetical protein
MKKLFIAQIIILLINCQIKAQFVPASVVGVPTGVAATYPRSTGNDILDVGSDTYRVWVWDPSGTTRGIAWNVNYGGISYTGTDNLTHTSNVLDPDVCLIQDGSTVYAIVAYYDANSSAWYWQAFEWTGSSFTSVAPAALFDYGNYGNTVNIDGGPGGTFVIVWDNLNGDVKALAGDLTLSPINIYSNQIISYNASSPDVSCYDGNDVHIVYINSNGQLQMNDYSFGDIAFLFPIAYATFLVSPGLGTGFNFFEPRIACPAATSGSWTNWTIVVQESDGSRNYIVGYNDGNTTPIIYNDGTFPISPANIITTPNYYASVTYDSNYPADGIWVGWTLDNSIGSWSTSSSNTIMPIVLQCDNNAYPLSNPRYWEVPDRLTPYDISDLLSLSGRNSNDVVFATYVNIVLGGSSTDDVYTKEITASSATSFRSSAKSSSISNSRIVNNSNEMLTLKLMDLNGRIIYTTSGMLGQLKMQLLKKQYSLLPAVYIVQFAAENGKTENQKLIITH